MFYDVIGTYWPQLINPRWASLVLPLKYGFGTQRYQPPWERCVTWEVENAEQQQEE